MPAAHRRRYRAPSAPSRGVGGARSGRRLRPGVLHGPSGVPLARRTGSDPGVRVLLLSALSAGLDSRSALPHGGRGGGGGFFFRAPRSLAEQALIPAFVFFFFLLYPPAWIRDRRFRTAGAAGGCILIRRAALERIGGMAHIRGELIDDCALARAVKDSGGRVWLGLSDTAVSLRQYRTFGEIGRMISRSAYTQLGHSVCLLI